MMGPHRHLQSIDIAGGGVPKTTRGGYGGSATGEAAVQQLLYFVFFSGNEKNLKYMNNNVKK